VRAKPSQAERLAKLERYRQDKASRKMEEKRAQRQPFRVGVYKLDGKFPVPSANQKASALSKTASVMSLAPSSKPRLASSKGSPLKKANEPRKGGNQTASKDGTRTETKREELARKAMQARKVADARKAASVRARRGLKLGPTSGEEKKSRTATKKVPQVVIAQEEKEVFEKNADEEKQPARRRSSRLQAKKALPVTSSSFLTPLNEDEDVGGEWDESKHTPGMRNLGSLTPKKSTSVKSKRKRMAGATPFKRRPVNFQVEDDEEDEAEQRDPESEAGPAPPTDPSSAPKKIRSAKKNRSARKGKAIALDDSFSPIEPARSSLRQNHAKAALNEECSQKKKEPVEAKSSKVTEREANVSVKKSGRKTRRTTKKGREKEKPKEKAIASSPLPDITVGGNDDEEKAVNEEEECLPSPAKSARLLNRNRRKTTTVIPASEDVEGVKGKTPRRSMRLEGKATSLTPALNALKSE